MSVLDSSDNPKNPILDYIENLPLTKKGLPYGQPVGVLMSPSLTDTASVLRVAAEIGPHIAVLQVQGDIMDDWSDDTIEQLTYLAKKHGFILWEGSKVLNATVNFMGRGNADWQTRMTLAQNVKKRYANGSTKIATWSGIATSWAPGVKLDAQEKDVLIPTLRNAAREVVAKTVKTIQTEISASESEDNTPEEKESVSVPLSPNAWQEFWPGYSRKLSTISVTESVTMQPLIQPEDGVPPPPLLARGIALCLPSAVDTAFTYEFRQATLGAACANSDFVLGFISSEPFFTNYRGNSLLDLAYQDGSGVVTSTAGRDLLASSPYMDKQHSLALFSLLPIELFYGFDTDPIHTLNGGPSPDDRPESVKKLFHVVGNALKLREISRKEYEVGQKDDDGTHSPSVLQVPFVILP
ncbi:hypothetical protein N7495_002211 [Penicillium taxi]|uniref:uncharacterized protein n=1 Tax=Penicillium taxi TaxID=168475 RepID=UPI0025451BC0|nr:uncharacterized protein N7495_002211 [Penicillium taxi]KAJ5901683.1 hypothetical protein N7495_002211 [Penicillium taxi]